MAKLKVALIALVLLLLSCLPGIASPPETANAAPDEVKWSRVNIPAEGEAGNWVLANGSDIQHLTMATDGTVYAYANPSGTSYTLFKSTDGGYSWSHVGQVKGAIVDIATPPDKSGIVYYATAASVYKSDDAGSSFKPLPPNPGGAGSGNITITSMAVSRVDGNNIIAVGTKDTDASQYGGVYTLDERQPFRGWTNTNIGNYDVLALAFSPNLAAGRQLVAAVTNEHDTLVTTRVDNSDWKKVISDATIDGLVPISAYLAFPGENGTATEEYVLFLAIDTGLGHGDVYRVTGVRAPGTSGAIDLDIGDAYNLSAIDVTSLAVTGDTVKTTLLAGTASSPQVYISPDNGQNWTRSKKEPSGQSRTYLLAAPDFSKSGLALAATGGAGSALSRTTDGGATWTQIGLIDSTIDSIVDLAPSPVYNQDNTMFMLTLGSEHSLWRSKNSGLNWERILTATQANADEIKEVELSTGYGNSNRTVFLAGTSYSQPATWKSTDNGQRFQRRGAPFSIDIWAAVNDDTIFFGSYNGTDGLFFHSRDGGLSYSDGVAVGSQPLKSIVSSPHYQQDKTILIGNTDGWVYLSSNNGTTFKPLPPDATSAPLTGEITVAFDPEFSRNKIIYAASATVNKGVYRFTVNKSTKWESIDSTLPVSGKISQLKASADGTLYASDLKADGGMERSLDPVYSLGPTFETVTRGLDSGAILNGLWLQGKQLWSVDDQNTRLMTYVDSLSQPITLRSPLNQTPGTGAGNVYLDWETLPGATTYEWQLDHDTDFSTIPTGFTATTQASSARSPSLEAATTYYWRVRATEPVSSRWSDKWSFTTNLGVEVIVPELYSPKAGAADTPVRPVFQWSTIAGADSYELLVSAEASLSNPIIVKVGEYSLATTAWQSNISLDYRSTYYWKVRAASTNSYSAWSAIGAFTTEPAPVSTSPSPAPSVSPPPSLPSLAPPSPPEPAQPSLPLTTQPPAIPVWVWYLGGALLLTIFLLLITLLTLVLTIKRF